MQEAIKNMKVKYIDINPSLPFYTEELFSNINNELDLNKIESLLNKLP